MVSLETMIIRLVLALVLGALIGLEREYREHAAGLKTLALVSLGSALMTIVSAYGFENLLGISPAIRFDPSRIAAQIVSGIGFLGAGTILLRKELIRGLTTSAAIWLVAGIGIACGAGLIVPALFSTGIALLLLVCVRPLERRLFPRRTAHTLRLRIEPEQAASHVIRDLHDILLREGIVLEHLELRPSRRGSLLEARCRAPSKEKLVSAVSHLHDIPEVRAVRADLQGAQSISPFSSNPLNQPTTDDEGDGALSSGK